MVSQLVCFSLLVDFMRLTKGVFGCVEGTTFRMFSASTSLLSFSFSLRSSPVSAGGVEITTWFVMGCLLDLVRGGEVIVVVCCSYGSCSGVSSGAGSCLAMDCCIVFM